MLFGGSIFAIFGGLYYWWPKMFGRVLDERLGKLHFWLVFIGFNLTFMPQHFLGLLGMPRRVYTYSTGGLWEVYNMISTIGSYVMALGMLVFVVNVVKTTRAGRRAGQRPVARATRSSGTRPRRRRRGTSTGSPTSSAPGRCATCAAGSRGGACDAGRSGPGRGCSRSAPSPGPALAVVSGAAGWGTAHRLLAALALPPLVGLVVARVDLRAAAAAGRRSRRSCSSGWRRC